MKSKKILAVFLSLCLVGLSMISVNAEVSGTDADNMDDSYLGEDYTNDNQGYALGGIPAVEGTYEYSVDYVESDQEQSTIINRDLPQSVDFSNELAFPVQGNQGNIASCVSWATTYYQFGYQVAKMNNWNARHVPAKKFSPKFVFNLVNKGVNVGSTFEENYEILKTMGAVRYSQFTPVTNINPNNYPTEYDLEYREWCTDADALKEGLEYKVTEQYTNKIAETDVSTPVSGVDSPYLSTMKSLLSSGHVLTFMTNWGYKINNAVNPIYTNGSANSNWIYGTISNASANGQKACIVCQNNSGSNEDYYHALSIVGYDDTIWYDYDGDNVQDSFEMGAFKVINSHGYAYGNYGWIWVMYDALNNISSFTSINPANRIPAMNLYDYHYIEVGRSDMDLVAELSVSQTDRSEHIISFGTVESSSVTHYRSLTTTSAGAYAYDGTTTSVPQTAAFLMDYDLLVSGLRDRRTYRVRLNDNQLGKPTGVNELSIVDRTGKTVVSETLNDTIDNSNIVYDYRIGMVGDINNDGLIDNTDVITLQSYLAEFITLSGEDLLVADVDADGSVNVSDVICLQRKNASLLDEFPNGAFEYLGA